MNLSDATNALTPRGATERLRTAVESGASQQNLTTYPASIATFALMLASLASTWTGVIISGIKPVDMLVAVAAILGWRQITLRNIPSWLVGGAVSLIVVYLAHEVFPTLSTYLSSRFELDNYVAPIFVASASDSPPIVTVVQWLAALVGVPLVTLALCQSQRSLELLLTCWMFGAALSALVSLSDFFGITHISESMLGFDNITGRQAGLASHVNNLGFACAMAAPVAVYMLGRPGKRRWLGSVSLALLVAGTLTSGSRGAQVGIVIAFLTMAVLSGAARRLIIPIVLFLTIVGCSVALSKPQLFSVFSTVVRFDRADAGASDSARERIAQQAIDDFRHNPLIGVGYEVLVEAHSVYLELLAAGGAILIVGMLLFWGGAIRSGLRLTRSTGSELASVAVACLVTWLLMGVVQNQLTDRYLYFPVAVIAALVAVRARSGTPPARRPDTVRTDPNP